MAAETVVYTPENSGNSVPAWMAMNNNGLFGNNGWGGGVRPLQARTLMAQT